jgi:hypothetical protein
MPAQPMDDEKLLWALELKRQHGSTSEAARAADVPRTTFQHWMKLAAERGLSGYGPVMPGFAVKTVSSRSLDGAWVKQAKAPGDVFEVPEGHAVKGVSALVDADGRTVQRWIKTREETVSEGLVEALKSVFDAYQGRAEASAAPDNTDSDLLSVYPIADQHLGLMSWARETGENFGLGIGSDRLRACMARVVAQSPPSRQAIILNLGDYFHADDSRNVTPRSGHSLDVDGRYFKVLSTGVQLMMDCIDLALQKHESVLVRNLPGNHDPHASVALTIALGAFYAREPRVTIDMDPSEFFYHRFGSTLIGAHHGHKAKAEDLVMSMATRRREDWGATRFHVHYSGHIHHFTGKEVAGVRCESFQTLAAKDAHSHSNSYDSGQSIQSITHHRTDGEAGRHRVNLAPALAA